MVVVAAFMVVLHEEARFGELLQEETSQEIYYFLGKMVAVTLVFSLKIEEGLFLLRPLSFSVSYRFLFIISTRCRVRYLYFG